MAEFPTNSGKSSSARQRRSAQVDADRVMTPGEQAYAESARGRKRKADAATDAVLNPSSAGDSVFNPGGTPNTADGSARQKKKREKVKDETGIMQGQEGALFSDRKGIDVGPDYTYSKMRLRKSENINPYADERDKQTKMDRRVKVCILLGIATLVALVIAIVVPNAIFSVNMRGVSMSEWVEEIQHRVGGFFSLVTFQGADYSMDFITFRFIIIALAGAALAISGAAYQGSLKNALASPTTLGVMQGANMGRIVYVLLFATSFQYTAGGHVSDITEWYASLSFGEYMMSMYGSSLCCLAGSAVVVVSVLAIASVSGKGRMSNAIMVVAGQVIATAIGAGVGLAQYYLTETGDTRLQILQSLQTESFSGVYRLQDIVLIGIPLIICIVAILMMSSRMNLLSFSHDEARSMGLDVNKLRWGMVAACTVLTAVVVAFCGQVGMIGFLIPHLVRRVVGPDFKYLIPASGLAGAAFLVFAEFALSQFDTGLLTNLGVFTSLLGGCVFLYTAIFRREEAQNAWQ